jgi:hypothetical protein
MDESLTAQRSLAMHVQLLGKLTHTKTLTVTHEGSSGWRVCEEEDGRVIVAVSYRDWHRVERVTQRFAEKARSLRAHGWTEQTPVVSSLRG